MIEAILARWYALPQPVRAAIVDSVETGLSAALAVQLVLPATITDIPRLVLTLGSAFGSAFVSALRRKAQAALDRRRAAREAALDAATAAEHTA